MRKTHRSARRWPRSALATPAYANLQRLRLRARMGRAVDRDRRRQGLGLHRHHRRAGPAPDPGAAQPDRQGAHRRHHGLHRRGTGDRLAADDRAAVRQRQDRRRRSPARSTPPTIVHLLEQPVAPRPRARATSTPRGNPHIQTDPRKMLPVAKALAARFAAARSGQRRAPTTRRLGRFRQALERGAGRNGRRKAAPLKGVPIAVQHHAWVYLENWLGLHRGRRRWSPSPACRRPAAISPRCCRSCRARRRRCIIRAAYEDDRPSAFISEQPNIPGRRAALHRRRHRSGARICSASTTTPSTACSQD